MDRKAACLAQADACRARAQADPANSDHWIEESIKWLERAIDPTGGLSMTFETRDEPQIATDETVPPVLSSGT
ncbi:hypothetical protein I6F35_12600 [Bradyrhizobium sp. BRP22]|uniref:hypothetical protein n=1 Tax=Bradyrhizobium sp. BRP22 TaxID=2793821 RepID=UPI001CD6605A|nr:hypothetical protein [Bradyrhizobium sp. BRP22]MCA1454052.1 hypothetical protein [Bradyrhizobium sp. BRP22]